MFRFSSLYSGSSGNCSFIETDHAKVLVDAGCSVKKIDEALQKNNINISDIDAILVTHEHSDHIKSVGAISSKFHIPVYANQKTWNAMPEQSKKILDECKKNFSLHNPFAIQDLQIEAFPIPHDAANPCGFNFFNHKKKMSIATDIGHISDELIEALSKSSFALIEANYDLNILRYSKYPFPLKQRISGPQGHLSNSESGVLISKLVRSGLQSVLLGHLSKENNFPELAYRTVVEELMRHSYDEKSLLLDVARRDTPSKQIDIA